MSLLPIAERELRVAARRRGTYWVRPAAAGAALVLAALMLMGLARESPVEQARALFFSLSFLAFSYAVLGGMLATADAISEEKRDGTLGLLFLTTLRGHDVVVGKLAAGSLRAVSGLVAVLPVMALPLLLGSIDARTVGHVALVLGNTMFLSMTLGVLVSVWARDPRGALGGGLLALGGLFVLVPVLRWLFIDYVLVDALHWYQPAPGRPEPLTWVLWSNPFMALWWAMSGVLRGGPAAGGDFVAAMWTQHGLAWVALLAACMRVPHSWRDGTVGGASGRPGSRRGTRMVALGGRLVRNRHLEPHPFAWIITRERRPLWRLWAGLLVIFGVWVWGYLEVRDDWLVPAMALVVLAAAGGWLKLQMAGMACRPWNEHRRSGALELLLCTPQTPADLTAGHLAGLRRTMLPPLVAVVAGAGVLMSAAVRQEGSMSDVQESVWAFLVMAVVLVLDLWTLAWAGMWQGLRRAKYLRAVAGTVGWVLVLPWALFLGGNLGIVIAGETFDLIASYDPGFWDLVVGWLVVVGVVDAGVLIRARSGLGTRLRDLAYAQDGVVPAGNTTPDARSRA